MPIRRVTIDDVLPGLIEPTDHEHTANHVQNLDALRKVAVALDQVVNREHDAERRFGRGDGSSSMANLGDIAEAIRHHRILELAAATARGMIDAMSDQIGLAPSSKPEKAEKPARKPRAPKTPTAETPTADDQADAQTTPEGTEPETGDHIADVGNMIPTLEPADETPAAETP